MIRRVGSEGWIGGGGVWSEVIKKGLSDEVIQEQRTMEEVRA